MAQIELRDVFKSFGNSKALNGVNCTLPCGMPETIALVGPNGAGKTTLLKIATGLLLPSSGEAAFVD